MPVGRNPFGGDGFSLVEMTEAINKVPRQYSRVQDLGIFRPERIGQRTLAVEVASDTLTLIPSQALNGPAAQNSSGKREVFTFSVPWIPLDAHLMASDVQGYATLGGQQPDTVAEAVARKLDLMARKHHQTREYMEINALRGVVKNGAGATLYDYFAVMGTSQLAVDFKLGTNATNVQGKCRDVLRHIEDNLLGEVMSEAHVFCDAVFFDKLTNHPKVREAYQYYLGANPNREDMRRRFAFGGLVFEENPGKATLSTGAVEAFIPAGEGVAFPLGTIDSYTTYIAPGNLLAAVNTLGEPMYADAVPDPKGRFLEIVTEQSILPLAKRPRMSIRLHTSD